MALEILVEWYVCSLKSRCNDPKQICLTFGDPKYKFNMKYLFIIQKSGCFSIVECFCFTDILKVLHLILYNNKYICYLVAISSPDSIIGKEEHYPIEDCQMTLFGTFVPHDL